MASDRTRCSRHCTPFLVAIAFFILSIVSFKYTWPSQIHPSLSSHPTSDAYSIDEAMDATKKHDKNSIEMTYPKISTLPASLLPTYPSIPRRLIIIGDVHGHLKSLEALLRKAEVSTSRGDTVIFAGDMVNKGPDSAGVVELAMQIGAFGVRGNHEDRVLRAWDYFERRRRERGAEVDSNGNSDDEGEEVEEESGLDENEGKTKTTPEDRGEESDSIDEGLENKEDDSESTSHKKKKDKKKGKKKKHKGHKPRHKDLATAKSLKPEHRAWLSDLPLILRIGDLGPRYGEVVVVHGGLVPGIPLEAQDPDAVMTMRTLIPFGSSASVAESDPESPTTPHTHTDDTQTPLSTDLLHDQASDDDVEAVTMLKKHPMVPSASRKGIPWSKIWTAYQSSLASSMPHPAPSTVVYGHDARAGLRMREYTFGLDTGCGNGDDLTGVIFEFGMHAETGGREQEEGDVDSGGKENEESRDQGWRPKLRHRLVSVSCAEAF